jgi:hypothetical protein
MSIGFDRSYDDPPPPHRAIALWTVRKDTRLWSIPET